MAARVFITSLHQFLLAEQSTEAKRKYVESTKKKKSTARSFHVLSLDPRCSRSPSATFAKDLRSTCVAFGYPIASERKSSQVRTCVDLR